MESVTNSALYQQSMEHMKEGLLDKFKSLVSVIYGIVLWVTRLSSAMQTPKPFPPHHNLQLGLRALVWSKAQHLMMSPSPSPLSSSSSSSSSFSSSSSPWSSAMGDLLGTESGVYMSSDEEKLPEVTKKTKPYSYGIQTKRNPKNGTKREINQYPPPIPSLARTGNLIGHMPWILTRHSVDGRLILREERVKHQEYFEAQRENGRLRLNLVPLDDAIKRCHSIEDENNGERSDCDDVGNKKRDEVEDDQVEEK